MALGERRVLIALDHMRQSPAGLREAVRLGQMLGGQLAVLYIEDERLISLAGMPFTCEINRTSGVVRNLDSNDLLRRMSGQIRSIRSLLASASGSGRPQISLEVVRGSFSRTVLHAPGQHDIVFLSAPDDRFARAGHAGQIARPSRAPVQVVVDGSAASLEALMLAREYASATGAGLLVVSIADQASQSGLLEEIRQRIGEPDATVRVMSLAAQGCADYLSSLSGQDCSVMVLPAALQLFESPAVTEKLESLNFPVLLVR